MVTNIGYDYALCFDDPHGTAAYIDKLVELNVKLKTALEASDELLRSLDYSGGFIGLAIMENNASVLGIKDDLS